MTQIIDRTPAQIVALTASYMKRDKSSLIDLCTRLGVPMTGTKAQLVARIVAKSSEIISDAPSFDYSGLHIPRLNVTITAI